jgi:hypothetical protein
MAGIWRFFVLSFDNNYLIITPKDLCDVFLALNQISFRDEMFGIKTIMSVSRRWRTRSITVGEESAKRLHHIPVPRKYLLLRNPPRLTISYPPNTHKLHVRNIREVAMVSSTHKLPFTPAPAPAPPTSPWHLHPQHPHHSPLLKLLKYIISKNRLLLISSIQSWWQSRRLPRKIKPAQDPVTC